MSEPSREQLEALLALQDTDLAVRRLTHQLDALPEQKQLDAVAARLAALQQEADDLRLDRGRAGEDQRRLERETDVLAQRRDVERARLYDGTVTNAREMRSVEAEIEGTVRRLDEHEESLLEVLEQVEQLDIRLAALDTELEQTKAELEAATGARDEAAKAIIAELAEARARRETQAEELADDLLARYEKVVARTSGVGVGRLENQSCTACRVEMSMADVGELRAGPPLTSCPECRRLLVVLD